ncbi:hypothetical protein [Peribacillus asahii]|uniref:hypothetical protein n=1 Tax=Peribacillus asahii TaxID=228899 RepID=UPI002079A55E|nr:hypothetical protein [Peribacillus asahii]USK68317.1 hypothetical protein LIS76_11800 [Peribacillus asahii]
MMIEQYKTASELDINPNALHNWKKKYASEFIYKFWDEIDTCPKKNLDLYTVFSVPIIL